MTLLMPPRTPPQRPRKYSVLTVHGISPADLKVLGEVTEKMFKLQFSQWFHTKIKQVLSQPIYSICITHNIIMTQVYLWEISDWNVNKSENCLYIYAQSEDQIYAILLSYLLLLLARVSYIVISLVSSYKSAEKTQRGKCTSCTPTRIFPVLRQKVA
jgi:hypothetical protein